ncbi:DUF4373 domain-containing protein [Lactiplantibacillus plantarum]|uniref:DUF4373 domain-containing protein n=1 Tax=Lactiplantibacillus plantarum TaxID=1590 RepID=UPI0021CB89FD|nr:DUF4373 domain-containing protein [Lactiplantibacillus plantarum]WAU30925.1 hypothetical protein OR568_02554 [Lactiplantibacillus plantarum]
MARPVKEGLDYFPLDVDFAVNDKTEAIMGEFGPKGVLFMIYLLSAVYQNGYYLQWNKLKQMQLANRIEGVSPELANQIVNRLIAYGTFSEELFNSAKVLTSQRIQETYEDATKRRKSQKPTKYWINVDINKDTSVVNVDINPQSKVNESKVNKSKSNNNKKNKTKPRDPRDRIQQEFTEQVWSIYPKKRDFQKAYNAYYAAKVEGVSLETIVAKINEYKAYLKLHGTGEYYTKSLDNWLGGRGWMDEYDMTPPTQPAADGSNQTSKEAQTYVRNDF